jgi:NADPH:quinone reductase-like Zn-dependent oxidoreductase
VVIRGHGGPDQLRLEEVPTPEPASGEALVRVHAAALNRLDLFVRQGLSGPGVRRIPLPLVPGADGAGVVAALGPDTHSLVSVGERVVAYPGLSCGLCHWCRRGEDSLCAKFGILGEDVWGTHADHVVVPIRSLLRVPDNVPFAVAAAAPVVYTTAWRMIVTAGQVIPGETVCVVGASGGVATAAIQIAVAAGARVIAVTRDPAKAVRVRETVDVDTVVADSEHRWSGQVLDMTDGVGAHMVADPVGAPTWQESIRALAKDGRMVTCGATGGDRANFSIRELYQSHRRIIGAPLGGFHDFEAAMRLVFRAVLRPVIHASFSLEDIAEVHELMARGEHVGKVVLQIH